MMQEEEHASLIEGHDSGFFYREGQPWTGLRFTLQTASTHPSTPDPQTEQSQRADSQESQIGQGGQSLASYADQARIVGRLGYLQEERINRGGGAARPRSQRRTLSSVTHAPPSSAGISPTKRNPRGGPCWDTVEMSRCIARFATTCANHKQEKMVYVIHLSTSR